MCLSSVALILSSAVCFGQNCPPNNDPTILGLETLDSSYQPSAYDPGNTTVLRRLRITPAGYGTNSKHPTVLTIPPTVFRNGDAYGTPAQRLADYDLAQAGYLVFSIEHRLAPPGMIKNQQGSGDPRPLVCPRCQQPDRGAGVE